MHKHKKIDKSYPLKIKPGPYVGAFAPPSWANYFRIMQFSPEIELYP